MPILSYIIKNRINCNNHIKPIHEFDSFCQRTLNEMFCNQPYN